MVLKYKSKRNLIILDIENSVKILLEYWFFFWTKWKFWQLPKYGIAGCTEQVKRGLQEGVFFSQEYTWELMVLRAKLKI